MIRFTGPDLKLYDSGIYGWYAHSQVTLLGDGKYLAQLYTKSGIDRDALRRLGCGNGMHTYLFDQNDPDTPRVLHQQAREVGGAVRHKETGKYYIPVDDVHGHTHYHDALDGLELLVVDKQPWRHDWPFTGRGHSDRRHRVGDVGLISGLNWHSGAEDLKFLLPQLRRVSNDDVVIVHYRGETAPSYEAMSMKTRNAVVAVRIADDGLTAAALCASEWAPFELVVWDLN